LCHWYSVVYWTCVGGALY